MVVGELARLGGEAEVGDRRDLDGAQLEAAFPLVFGLVLELQLQRLVLEIRQACFGGGGGVAKAAGLLVERGQLVALLVAVWLCRAAVLKESYSEEATKVTERATAKGTGSTYGAASQLVRLAVVVPIIGCLAVSQHGHHVGKHGSRPVVLVRVEEDAQPFELISVAEHGPALCALLREPHGHAVAVQRPRAVDLELDFDLVGQPLSVSAPVATAG